ncbi:hypothetical protein [Thioclava sp. F36-6]|uniref:hypothetical protein n=1 Tax=Thioclava sp. F36-6 TaxID=1915316 RepID=UPI0009978BFC|nr:hypothetical protein [Thioclava sp. F36-6]OOY30460.1 hypothetical protein BMI88_14905 [Thioclava sp. F36-6]
MKNQVKYLVLAGAVAGLAGCGGGGSSSSTPAVRDYATLLSEAQQMAQDTGVIDTNTGTIDPTATARTTLPANGSGTYTGYVSGSANGGELIGELTLTADLGTPQISGSAANFQHETDGAYSGTMAMPNVPISTNLAGEQEFAGQLSGDLDNGGTTYATVIGMTGHFYDGDNGVNTIAGDTTTTIALIPQPDPGVFIATQQP